MFGAVFKAPLREPSLVCTLASASRGTDGDVAGVALLEGHSFLSCADTMAQSAHRQLGRKFTRKV